jgi:hypothetical protein
MSNSDNIGVSAASKTAMSVNVYAELLKEFARWIIALSFAQKPLEFPSTNWRTMYNFTRRDGWHKA